MKIGLLEKMRIRGGENFNRIWLKITLKKSNNAKSPNQKFKLSEEFSSRPNEQPGNLWKDEVLEIFLIIIFYWISF